LNLRSDLMTSPQNESAGSSQLGRSASDLGQQAKETAGRIADQELSKKKASATGLLEQVAGALQMTGEHLRDSQQERIARFAQQASDQVRQFSESIRGAQPRDVVRRVEDLARSEPALFLGGAFLLGLLGARFLKSSERTGETRGSPRLPRLERRGTDEYVPGGVGAGSSGGIDEDLRSPGDEPGGAVREH
jgi:hypothetical protein